jgi:hypothetical protein
VSGSVVHPSAVDAPSTGAIDRSAGSIRRTSHIDMVPHGTTLEGLGLRASARDLRTARGGAVIVATARLEAELGPQRVLQTLRTEPSLDALQELVGMPVARGFRKALGEVVGGELAGQTPLALLVDDLPIAVLISGYADSHVWEHTPVDVSSTRADICAGWAHDGTMLTLTAETGYRPQPVGPEAPSLERDDDPLAWHDVPALTEGAMRRRRLIDVRPWAARGAGFDVHAMFRDTYQRDGIERILHEYTLAARVEDGVFTACEARPRVLPWPECPSAAASATRIVDETVTTARELVRANFRGTSTCTHLNDLLCTLADVSALVAALTSDGDD